MTDRENFEAWVRNTKGESFLSHAESPALWGGDTTEHDANPYQHPWTRGALEGWQAALASQQSADDGWIDWAGGECPVPANALVEVRYKSGGEGPASRAAAYDWSHNMEDCYPIGAYRVVKP